jgi:hypothetical protein
MPTSATDAGLPMFLVFERVPAISIRRWKAGRIPTKWGIESILTASIRPNVADSISEGFNAQRLALGL